MAGVLWTDDQFIIGRLSKELRGYGGNRKGGIILKRQGGQDIIEFAVMIPFFFLCIIAIAAFDIYFGDWVTYQNLTRSLARDAVVAEISNNSRTPDFGDMQRKYYKLFNSMGSSVYYVKDATNDIQLSIVDADNKSNPKYAYGQLSDSDSGADQKANPPYSLVVAVKLTKNDTGKGFFANMKWANIAFPDTMNITYFMYDENNPLNRAGN